MKGNVTIFSWHAKMKARDAFKTIAAVWVV